MGTGMEPVSFPRGARLCDKHVRIWHLSAFHSNPVLLMWLLLNHFVVEEIGALRQ